MYITLFFKIRINKVFIIIFKIKSVKQISQHFKATEPYLQMKLLRNQVKQLKAKSILGDSSGRSPNLLSQAPPTPPLKYLR